MSAQTAPWYRHGWVWFLLALPAAVVVASFVTLYIALANPSSLVRDDYYREGLGINRRLEQARNARGRGIEAALAIEGASARLRISAIDLPARLELALLHPTDAQRDVFVVLERVAPGIYEAPLPVAPDGRRHLQLSEPGTASAWLLQGLYEPRSQAPAELRPADG